MEIPGTIEVVGAELHFAISGNVAKILTSPGSLVKQGQLLAQLEAELLQSYLDRALKQYEKNRAEFDAASGKEPNQFEKRILQNELEIAVKNVEIAKANLEETKLSAPLSGLVIAIEPNIVGINITPSQFTITLIDPHSYFFQGQATEKDALTINPGKDMRVVLINHNREIQAKVTFVNPISQTKEGTYEVTAELTNKTGLLSGMKAKAVL